MKDPAVLFYISDWLTSTAEMDADCRGWYLNLLLHNYDKGSLPNDIETLANLAGVKFSEYERFKQVFEQVLKHKFEQNSEQRLNNPRTNEILKRREVFKEKRSQAGKMSYLIRYFKKTFKREMTKDLEEYIKSNMTYEYLENIDLKNEQVLKQVFKQMFELYRNGNGNENKVIKKGGEGGKTKSKNNEFDLSYVSTPLKELVREFIRYRRQDINKPFKTDRGVKTFYNKLVELSNNNYSKAKELVEHAKGKEWQSVYPIQDMQKSESKITNKNINDLWNSRK